MTFNPPVPPALQLPADRLARHIESAATECAASLFERETFGAENSSLHGWRARAIFDGFAVGRVPIRAEMAIPLGSCEGETPRACGKRRLRRQLGIGSKQGR